MKVRVLLLGASAIDLADMLPLYLQLRSRGGVHPLDDSEDEAADEHAGTVIERRRYRLHRTIERSSSASRKAKSVHGYICQGCGFDFETIYGAVGHEFIEAHHLTPLADLPEDIPVSLDPRDDFAVLCANCRRMMHRKDGPRTIVEIKSLAQVVVVKNFHNRLRSERD